MRFLSLSRPWPWAIFDLPEPDAKRVENRVWPCHPSVVGQVLALHAAKSWDGNGLEYMRRLGFAPPLAGDPAYIDSHLIGVAVVDRVVSEPSTLAPDQRRWYMGDERGLNAAGRQVFGWVLRDVQKLPRPIRLKGAQGLRSLDADIAAEIVAQLGLELAA